MNKVFAAFCLAGALVMAAGCGPRKSGKTAEEQPAPATEQQDSIIKEISAMEKIAKLPEEPMFDIFTTMGTIRIKLYSGTPKHRDNFAKLAFEGFYDGILFHRIIPGFMIQVGDPLTKDMANKPMFGTGGPGYTIPAEIKSEYYHKKGALAAARRGDAANPRRESSGSQFYIVQDEFGCMHLDGQYTVFGETVEGLDVIDAIAAVATDGRDCPLEPVKIIEIKLVQ